MREESFAQVPSQCLAAAGRRPATEGWGPVLGLQGVGVSLPPSVGSTRSLPRDTALGALLSPTSSLSSRPFDCTSVFSWGPGQEGKGHSVNLRSTTVGSS